LLVKDARTHEHAFEVHHDILQDTVTLLHGTFALRLCIINHTTTWDDVREPLETAERFGRETSIK
jgi:hypothetical protein